MEKKKRKLSITIAFKIIVVDNCNIHILSTNIIVIPVMYVYSIEYIKNKWTRNVKEYGLQTHVFYILIGIYDMENTFIHGFLCYATQETWNIHKRVCFF